MSKAQRKVAITERKAVDIRMWVKIQVNLSDEISKVNPWTVGYKEVHVNYSSSVEAGRRFTNCS